MGGEAWQVDPADLPEIMPGLLKQKSCFDGNRRDTVSGRYQNEIGWNGLEMKYAAISLESNVLDPFGLDAESVTRREYDQFVAIQNEQDDIVSKSCRGFPIMTDLDDKFTFMNNQVIYQRSAIQSSCLGVAIAFGVLLISTRVFHLAFFASLSIDAEAGKECKVKYTSADQENTEGDGNSQTTALDCGSLVDDLIVHEGEFVVQVGHYWESTAAFGHDVILFILNSHKLIVFTASDGLSIQPEWIKDIAF